jgi:periplasmic divalent cation tolerance protein
MSEIVTVYATFANDSEAQSIGRILVEEGLAACANILATCRSIYRWEGEVEEAQEVPALFKTTAALAPTLIARLGELHSYDVPAAVVWPIAESLPDYTAWIAAETSR